VYLVKIIESPSLKSVSETEHRQQRRTRQGRNRVDEKKEEDGMQWTEASPPYFPKSAPMQSVSFQSHLC